MGRDVSFMQYLRAHGNTAGPTQRPLLTGAIAGLIAFVPFEVVLRISGARQAIAEAFAFSIWVSTFIGALLMLIAGIAYSALFKRAANDVRGGWVFGASFGFVVWLVAPITLWQLITSQPIAVGKAAIGVFGAHILFGFALGLMFPWIHFLIQSKLENGNRRRSEFRDEGGT